MNDPEGRASSQRRHYPKRLIDVVRKVNIKLAKLAYLGRPGQWVLYHEDLYHPFTDPRPHSRNPNKETLIVGLSSLTPGTIWAGTGPVPDFTDIAFWEAKNKDLGDKIQQIEAGRVQPRFTPDELATLASLERQPGHVYHDKLKRELAALHQNKKGVFKALFALAKLGRPGQWVLHNEELYHPVIDTRPGTRATATNVVIRDSTFDGHDLFLGNGGDILADFELTWAARQRAGLPAPDFQDPAYWKAKLADLSNQLRLAEGGLVQPCFTPEECRALERMEADKDHAFAIFAKEAREARDHPSAIQTPEALALKISLYQLRSMVVSVMEDLWESGLAGKWVLHGEDLYLTYYDTHFRDRDGGDGDNGPHAEYVVVDSSLDLRIDTHLWSRFRQKQQQLQASLDDLGTTAYWEQKKADLKQKRDSVRAGRLAKHHFSDGELMRIELLERALAEKLEEEIGLKPGAEKTGRIAAWLDDGKVNTDTGAHAKTTRKRKEREIGADAEPDGENQPLSGRSTRSMRPAKRKKVQEQQQEPPLTVPPTATATATQTQQRVPLQTQEPSQRRQTKGSVRTAPPGPAAMPAMQAPKKRGDRSAQGLSLRRSARIAAQESIKYTA